MEKDGSLTPMCFCEPCQNKRKAELLMNVYTTVFPMLAKFLRGKK